MSWKELSEPEWRAQGGHRPSGPLAVMFAAAGVLTIIAAFLLFMLLRERQTLSLSAPMTMQQYVIFSSMIVVLSTFLWGIGSFVSILTRWRHGPTVIVGLTVLWVVCAVGAPVLSSYLLSGSLGSVLLLPNVFFHVAIAAGVCGYMLDGYRPNLYFRRRVRTTA